jgi:glutathionylspermidine synthase
MLRSPEPAILDAMQIEYLMWSAYVAGEPKPLAVPIPWSREDWSQVASISERFAALIRRTVDLCLDHPEIVGYWDFPPGLERMIAADRRRARRELDLLARFDVFRTPEGWKLSEFNTDVPGGIHEAAGLNDLVAGDRAEFSVVTALTDLTCRDRVRPRVGLLYASGFGEDLEQCQFLRMHWNRRGIPTTLASPSNLKYDGARLTLFDEPVDVLYRFFPAEWLDGMPELDGLIGAVADGAVRMVNPFAQLVAQSKKIMAFWYERADLLTASERELVRRHVPPTERFQEARLEDYVARRESIVVKRGFGRVGEQVLFGAFCSDDEWRDELEWPLSEPGEWIVQDRFDVLPVRLEGEVLYPCYGAYVVGPRFGGLYTRAAREPFIAADAFTAAVKVAPC